MSTQICNPCADGKVCIEGLDNYSLQDDTYYFVLNCLPNVYCGGASTIYLVCCDGTTMQQTIPQGSTVARRNALIADLVSRCARLTTFCAGGDGGDRPPGTNVPNDGTDPNNPVPYYGNYPKGWTVRCPDGNPYTFTVPAGMFIARTQAEADAAAQLWAKQVATVSKICVSAPQRVCCNGVAYSSTVVASGGPISAGGGTSNFTWAIIGTLPTGLTAVPFGHNALRISGIPTTNGTYSFTIRAVDSTGAYMNKPTSIRVWGITDTSLPDATEGSNYTHQLTTTSGTAPYTYTLVSGGFPLGITLSSAGLIDGLAGEAGAFTSVIRVRDANGATCSKELTLTSAIGTDVFAYFNCDEVAGTGIVDVVSGLTLTKSTLAFPTETGFIGTSVRTGAYPADPFFKASNFYTQLADASHWDFSTSSWTIRMWVKIINGTENIWLASALSTPDQFRMLWLSTGNVEFTALLGAGWETITVPMASGAWHRIIAYYEKGVGLGMLVDDGLPTLAVNTNLIGAGNQRLLIGGPLGYGVPPVAYGNIDEVAIWKRLLTADEIIYDWNSGAGKTYPDIP